MTRSSPRSGKTAPEPGHEPNRRDRIGTPPKSVIDAPEPADPMLALEAAQYIAQMSAELAVMARGANLDLLAYFLDMARVEATSSVRKLEGRPE
jgi:hypothetical protein